jgi:hypothetical protein
MKKVAYYLKNLWRSQVLCALMLSSVLLMGTMAITSCNGKTVAQDIVNWTPMLQSAVATVDSTATLLAPQYAPIFLAATVGFDAASDLLVAQAKAYLANPSAGVLAQLQAAVVAFQQQVNASLLSAAKITDPLTQQHVLNAVNAVATVVEAMLALVVSISSKSSVAQMTLDSNIKLAAIEPFRNEMQAVKMVASHYGEPQLMAELDISMAQYQLAHAGF